MERAGVLLSVAYDGRSFAGFAPQPAQRTIAGELLGALRALDPGVREVRGASRADAGSSEMLLERIAAVMRRR